MLFCVSPSHPNLESFDCFSATQIPILDLTCMYYFSIFFVSTQHSKLASHCAYARQIQQAIVPLPQGAFRQRVDTIKREMFSQKSVRRFVGDSSAFVMGAMFVASALNRGIFPWY